MSEEFIAWSGMSVPEPERPTFLHPVVGILVWHVQWKWWEGTPEFKAGRRITVRVLGSEDTARQQPAFDYLGVLFQRVQGDDGPYRARAARDLLAVYNRRWRDDWTDETDIDEATFQSRLTLLAIHVESSWLRSLSATLTYSAQDMFTEHNVGVSVDNSGGPTGAILE